MQLRSTCKLSIKLCYVYLVHVYVYLLNWAMCTHHVLLNRPTVLFHRAKDPVKVHVWGGISLRGRMGVCIFQGKMNATMYVNILRTTLKPFLDEVYPDSHRFMQGNDPKHTASTTL